ncbi:hypothetical protein T03_6023 [Trichinella britovi]|uniref:Uncharacterized protein n=1 Tax=Trichinella britovi TaxID=45882 RepID=A0A0V1BHP9_TRIBR|nr:hypothetical protein T03_6023 [Trichinella britovi]
MKGKQLLVPGGDNFKLPITAPAVTLSQQLHTILVRSQPEAQQYPVAWPDVVGISSNGCSTLCSGPVPTSENERQFLGCWIHCLPVHHKLLILASDPLQPANSIHLAAADGAMHGHLNAALCMLTGSDDISGIKQHFTSCFISVLPLTPVLVITESISASIFCSLPSSPESRIHHNFSRQISDDNI